jgi:hypothetical protein
MSGFWSSEFWAAGFWSAGFWEELAAEPAADDDTAGAPINTRRRIVRRELLPLSSHSAPQPTKRARRRRQADILLLDH